VTLKDGFNDIMKVIEKCRTFRHANDEEITASNLAKELDVTEERANLDYLSEEIPKSITQILDGVDRVSTIVKSMKAFSHPDMKEMRPADLNQAIRDTLTISRNEYKYLAEVETSFDEDLPPVPCYLSELNQVFLNLIVNAAHAISDANRDKKVLGERGLISIRTRKENNEVVIEVSDTGTGISENVAPHVFEHFFTTKDVDKGSVQGLSIAQSVITKKHHGTIYFETEVGKGTTFFIRLPLELPQSVNACRNL
jgi:signal transduction histidine kinase